ncbi:NAD(P)-binding Rossmann-fold superfamily protein [Actinidia rufa]|uniref:NAD(P)-binding Rossmann-fold superfamily protein n=1 Tax=Actinidia rufa TaxID=165716 RepID=A0A7J0FZT7_9ERIC|nr:NAD(P)-binding Rossmann-fold superfamily protein [Actinidia rufa]
MKKLDGKVAIITGGASGIGEATAHAFANHGARAVVILDLDFSRFDRLFAVNVRGMAACVKHAARAMVDGRVRGSIVCTASVAASRAARVRTDYTMSKHAVLGLVRAASQQLGEHGIRVNSVSPYAVATPMIRNEIGKEAEEIERLATDVMPLKGMALKAETHRRCGGVPRLR